MGAGEMVEGCYPVMTYAEFNIMIAISTIVFYGVFHLLTFS